MRAPRDLAHCFENVFQCRPPDVLTNLPHLSPQRASPSPPRPMLMSCVHCGCSWHSCLSGCRRQTFSPPRMTSRVSWNVTQCPDCVLYVGGCPPVREKRGLPSPALLTAARKVPRLPPAAKSTSVILEGTWGPDGEPGAFCTLSPTRQDDSTGCSWKGLPTC